MALQCNTALTTRSGFSVASGSYIWLQEERATDNKYSVKVRLLFFKDKVSFDAGRLRFVPLELTDEFLSFYQTFTPANYATLTSSTIHNYVKSQLETQLGNGVISIVQ